MGGSKFRHTGAEEMCQVTAEVRGPAERSGGVWESHDPGACTSPDKCLSSPQSPKESLEQTGTDYKGPGEERQIGEPGVLREDVLQKVDYRHNLNYTKNFGGRGNERMASLKHCFPKGNLWKWGKKIYVSRGKICWLVILGNLVKPVSLLKDSSD